MCGKHERIVGARLGPGKDDNHEGLVPNRVVSSTSAGIEYESDVLQVGRLIQDVHFLRASAVTTTRTKSLPHQLEQEQLLSMYDFMLFRGQAAHANYGLIGRLWDDPRFLLY